MLDRIALHLGGAPLVAGDFEPTVTDQQGLVGGSFPSGTARVENVLGNTIRELAERLRDHGLGLHEFTVALTRVARTEERILGEETELTLVEAHLAEMTHTFDERESRLRYVFMQLDQERSRLAGELPVKAGTMPHPAAAAESHGEPPSEDLTPHIAELEQRMAELRAERQQLFATLERRRAIHRQALQSWTKRSRDESRALRELVLQARPQVAIRDLTRLYELVDVLAGACREE